MNDTHYSRASGSSVDAYSLCLGLLSVACGGAMLAAPRLFGAVFALPASRSLVRLLGARDLLIGGALLAPSSRRVGLVLRSLSDTGDGMMIATEMARDRTNVVHGGIALAVAGLSAATSIWLALRSPQRRARSVA
jgi:hypothetical protein